MAKKHEDLATSDQDESGNFSDIDDQEVDGYLNNMKEKYYKKIIWEYEHQKYLKEQAAKKAAAAAAAKSRKEMKQRRAQQAKNSGPAQSAAEAACQMEKTKRLSKKINFDCLAKLFEDKPEDAGNPKKARFDLPSDNHDKFQSKVEDQKDDELGSADNFEDGDQDWDNNENMDDAYFHEEDGHNYDDDYY
ncbi:uncharacterized protein [Cicer arietinum]|uniref:Transcription factor IIIB 60 kDa subunit-like isoform X2 n=1 Tax=Cicer arietinum TaxID=3827 RepID=A0A3Q7YE47_CICAR|nr:transcription factor IIIB 60 kDa subunit-like isoform X2 [Cicer arietinum]